MKCRKRIYLYVLLLVVAVAAMIWLRDLSHDHGNHSSTPRDYNEIIAAGELNVVTDYNSIGYYVSDDSTRGFQLEMMQALEKDWGVKVNLFLENSLDQSLEGLLQHRYDLVARNIPVNAELKSRFSFTDPIILSKLVLVQRKAAYNNDIEPIRRQLDLAKKTIHVPKNSPAILRLNNLSHEIGDTLFIKEDPTYETEQLVIMVAAGDIDFTVCDEKAAMRLAGFLPEIDIETDIGFTQLESWAVRKDAPVLLDSLNSWFRRFKETPAFERIFEQYY